MTAEANRIGHAFALAEREGRAALIVYLCAGDPDLDTTVQLIVSAARAGADVIELGMPFSDPTADGPVIQRASERALAKGTTLRGTLEAARRARALTDVPIVLFGYYNPLLAFGETKVVDAAKAAGVDGFLVVDLPPEEAGSLTAALRKAGLDFVPLVAPTTPDARVDRVAEVAGSFIYYVSITGVTGAEADLVAAGKRAAEVRARTGKRVAIGFGIKTPAQAHQAALHADGVVVGSAACAAIESARDAADAVARVVEVVTALRAACAR